MVFERPQNKETTGKAADSLNADSSSVDSSSVDSSSADSLSADSLSGNSVSGKNHTFSPGFNPVFDVDLKKKYSKKFSDGTVYQYGYAWERFCDWCDQNGFSYEPATDDTVENFMIDLAESKKRFSTIMVYLSAISYMHKQKGFDSPIRSDLIRDRIIGIKRQIGTAQVGVDPILVGDLEKMIDQIDDSIDGMRDKAIILVGWWGAFRRSELVGVTRGSVTFVDEGMKITIARSKTDQFGKGITKAIMKQKKLCPVQALKDWMIIAPESRYLICHTGNATGVKTAEGNRISARMVDRIVKKYAYMAGLPGRYAGHSLRSGFVTSAARAGKSDRDIMRITGHKTRASLDKYVRIADEFESNAGDGIV